jgi:hypothetical protein
MPIACTLPKLKDHIENNDKPKQQNVLRKQGWLMRKFKQWVQIFNLD